MIHISMLITSGVVDGVVEWPVEQRLLAALLLLGAAAVGGLLHDLGRGGPTPQADLRGDDEYPEAA